MDDKVVNIHIRLGVFGKHRHGPDLECYFSSAALAIVYFGSLG